MKIGKMNNIMNTLLGISMITILVGALFKLDHMTFLWGGDVTKSNPQMLINETTLLINSEKEKGGGKGKTSSLMFKSCPSSLIPLIPL